MRTKGMRAMWNSQNIPGRRNQPEIGAEAYLAIPTRKSKQIVEIRSWNAERSPTKRFEGDTKDEKPTSG